MLFNSLQYLVFLIAMAVGYFVLPHRFRWILLLGGSYFFYMCWNAQYALLMLTSTFITYMSGIMISRANEIPDMRTRSSRKKLFVFISFFLNLTILFFFKYYRFFAASLESLTELLHTAMKMPDLNVLLPVGISFYTFQALSYTMDVYRGDVKATTHFGKYALFVSFFPQLVAGPIERTPNLLKQFDEVHSFDYDRARDGVLLILWGLFKKTVIADRLAVLVNAVYNHPGNYHGSEFLVATIFFAIQIYCDFSAYSDIAIGSANILGFRLMCNFNRPYFSKSIAEFWRRWHISLSTWFKDYLYFPLGGSKVGKIRHLLNLLIVFVVSGLWHGANWTFVIWGFLHGIYQVIGVATRKLREQFKLLIGLTPASVSAKLIGGAATAALVLFAWIFFRANNLADALHIIRGIATINPGGLLGSGLLRLGLDQYEMIIAIGSIALLFIVEYFQRNGDIRCKLKKEFFVIRWAVYLFLMLSIILTGFYGDLNAAQFIYFQF